MSSIDEAVYIPVFSVQPFNAMGNKALGSQYPLWSGGLSATFETLLGLEVRKLTIQRHFIGYLGICVYHAGFDNAAMDLTISANNPTIACNGI